ncbi:hypothetical protein KSF78_0007904 [Schistosoma japonicum]|nr:hypothetical protein KSF78_0007904 [Schistosoma japonicum]
MKLNDIYSYLLSIDKYLCLLPCAEAMQTPFGLPTPPKYFTSVKQLKEYLRELILYYQYHGRQRAFQYKQKLSCHCRLYLPDDYAYVVLTGELFNI